MRFLTDQDVYQSTIQFLIGLGHDVVTAASLGMAKAVDADLLSTAQRLGRIFVTRDRDFGALAFLQQLGAGVIYLRMLPSTATAVHAELKRVLSQYRELDLLAAFVVVEAGRHRFRRLRP